MIIQQNPQQQQPTSQPLATSVQIRQNLALKQIDQNAQPILASGQPLSPTNSAISAANRQNQLDQKLLNNGGKQQELKGVPNIVGLTSIDYQIDDKFIIELDQIATSFDPSNTYLNKIYDENSVEFPFKQSSELIRPNDHYQLFRINIRLPNLMSLEHFEIQLQHQNSELFSKYLRLLSIETLQDDQELIDGDIQKLHLKSSFMDTNKSQLLYQQTLFRVLELHTAGMSQNVSLVFLYLLKNRANIKVIMEMAEKKKEKMFSKTVNVSEKIKNEILPLLNGSDEDIDELDDEVAMISNKRGQDQKSQNNKVSNERIKDMVSTDDIKIEFKGQQQPTQQKKNVKTNEQQKSQITNKNLQIQTNNNQNNNDDDEETRNFNTLPRNYSDPLNKGAMNNANPSSYNNDIEFGTQQIDQHLLQQDFNILTDSQNIHQNSHSEIFHFAEQDIFCSSQEMQSEINKLLQKTIQNIKISGFNCNHIPAITNMTYFINQSFLLKQHKILDDALEYEYLGGILMISTKRFTQALEVFRKIQYQYILKIEQLQKNLNNFQVKHAIKKLYVKCSILELLIAESMCQPNQINDKLHSLKRMVDLFQCKLVPKMTFAPQILQSEDPFSMLIKFLPQILKFTVMCLTHKKEIVRMSALKLIEFILETQGCSLDLAMVFILKALMKTYPTNWVDQQAKEKDNVKHNESFSVKGFTQSVQEFFQYQETQDAREAFPKDEHTKYITIKEPTSGFQNALKNAYNHSIETYISVLSSISSHILHQVFYEVILPQVIASSQDKGIYDIKIFSIKIAEKIITICQGDLFLTKGVLEYFLSAVVPKNPAASQSQPVSANTSTSQNDTISTSIRNLWSSIRTKVFTNYSQKGLKILIEWLVEKMSLIAQNAQNSVGQPLLTDSSHNPDISKIEINDEECQQLLQLFDIVSMISVGRKNNEAEANSLIKIKQEYCLELYVLINPLMFWLDFSVEREDRFPLFKAIYSTIKDVLENLPPKRNDIDLLQIMEPILLRTKDYLKNNSPSLQMLKFLDLVLRDIKQQGYCQGNPELQTFFLEMLDNFVGYISYCLHEEVFSVFDKLFALSGDVINKSVLIKCIQAMVDKYTMKNRGHKNSMTILMKNLLEVNVREHIKNNPSNDTVGDSDEDVEEHISIESKNNYFETLVDFCFFNNQDPFPIEGTPALREDFKSPLDLHDLYVDKLQFFIDIFQQLTEMHVNLFAKVIANPLFKQALLGLLEKGEIQLRLKCHEILEIVCNYYVQHCPSKTVYRLQNPDTSRNQNEVIEVQFINHERLHLSQIVLNCIQYSLDKQNDSYLQFNSLILLDFLFQQMLPVPTYQNEIQKDKINQSSGNRERRNEKILDLQNDAITQQTPEYEVTSSQYSLMRLDLIFKLWPHVQLALMSPWSNIRSICYGLICSMLKIDVKTLQNEKSTSNPQLGQQYSQKLKQLVIPMLQCLLSSKESESKAGGLNILGSFCGLSYDFSKVKISQNMEFFKKNSKFISSQIWQLVFELQDDWDITIKEASVVLIQLCAPRSAVKYFDAKKKELSEKRFKQILQGYGLGENGLSGQDSSRMSSARDPNIFIQHSIASNEDTIQLGDRISSKINTIGSGTTTNKNVNILNYLNNGQDDMSMLFKLEQQNIGNDQQFTGTQIFDRIGDTINSGLFTQNVMNQIMELNVINLENQQQKELDLDEDIRRFETRAQVIDNEEEKFEFFVDKYQDDQIQEIISIFRNDFKPPKSLWIEKNQQGSSYNSPDYYAEIYSSAIDQFNQQQMQLQQQQQQQQQLMVSNSPKNSNKNSITGSIVDALEDDLVKKFENEKKEKEKLQNKDLKEGGQKAPQDNYKIFERHYEDGKEEQKQPPVVQQVIEPIQISNPQLLDGSIDAEPYQFLDSSPIKDLADKPQQQAKKQKKSKEEKKKVQTQPQPQNQLQLQILDVAEQKQFQNNNPMKITENIGGVPFNEDTFKQRKKSQNKDKKTTDELIEEYERKISKTKQLLEEEKKKTKGVSQNIYETGDKVSQSDPAIKSTPDFKSKKETNISVNQPKPYQYFEEQQSHLQKSNEKKKGSQSYVTEIPKSYQSNLDNAKLMKQINNCFNDNSFNNINIGPVVMTATIGNTMGSTKHKQKLNKSFENILAANKYNLKNNEQVVKGHKQKNLSTSPRRGSSSGKKNNYKSSGNSKKKYLDQSYQHNTSKNQTKALYNMRDLNYFIKTIEKDLSDKFGKMNSKDFSSMPTTPTSILKKVEDQMKALATQNLLNPKLDIKSQMSNTCPNITQVLSQLDTYGGSKNITNHQAYLSNPQKDNQKQNVLQISNLKMNSGNENLKLGQGAVSEVFNSTNHTPSNISNNGGGNLIMAQSQNSLSGYSLGHQHEKFTFSKTQKLDLKDATKNLFSYQIPNREGHTARDNSNENKKYKVQQFAEEAQARNNSKNQKNSQTKRSRGSQEKYLTNNQVLINNPSGSSSFTKLNKSLNNISQVAAQVQNQNKKKEQLSKSMINNFVKANNMSPNNKKLVQQMIKSQLSGAPSQATTQINQTASHAQNMNNQYSYSSNLLYDYIANSDQASKKISQQNVKTPVKNQNYSKVTGKIGNYSEILDISPSSGEKEIRYFTKNML